MDKIFNRHKIIFGLLLIVLIVIGEIVFHNLELPTWPAFICMVLFLMGHSDTKNTPDILMGGLLGIACLVILQWFVGLLAPTIEIFPAQVLFVVIFVASIVLLKDTLPYLFNDYAFMFFIVSALAAKGPNPAPFEWMAIEVVGGGLFIAGIVGIHKLMNTSSHDGSIDLNS